MYITIAGNDTNFKGKSIILPGGKPEEERKLATIYIYTYRAKGHVLIPINS